MVLRTKISAFDRYFFGLGEIGMIQSADGVKIYFVTIPAHKFLYIKNRESNGYWDFWQKQNLFAINGVSATFTIRKPALENPFYWFMI